jgi:hypothetical protein
MIHRPGARQADAYPDAHSPAGLGDELPSVARTEPTASCGGSTTDLADARRRHHLG